MVCKSKSFEICSVLPNWSTTISTSNVSDHYDAFTFMIAAEKMRLAGQISEEEMRLFYDVKTQNATDDHSSQPSVDEDIPEWIDSGVWKDVIYLDTLPGFQGLKEAILSNSALWKEYFEVSVAFYEVFQTSHTILTKSPNPAHYWYPSLPDFSNICFYIAVHLSLSV